MPITIDDCSKIPIFPIYALDLTFYPPDDPSAENCVGVIQTPTQICLTLTQTDMDLGIPILRNMYSVLDYDTLNAAGVFPSNTGARSRVQPWLGPMQVMDPTTATAECQQVRILRQLITSDSGSGSTSTGLVQSLPKKGLSVGIEVLIGLVGSFGLCFAFFRARFVYMMRKWLAETHADAGPRDSTIGTDSKEGSYLLNERRYGPVSSKSRSSVPSEDKLRMKHHQYKRRRDMGSFYPDSATTRVSDNDAVVDELGALNAKASERESLLEDFSPNPWAKTMLTDGHPLLFSQTLALPLPTMHGHTSPYAERQSRLCDPCSRTPTHTQITGIEHRRARLPVRPQRARATSQYSRCRHERAQSRLGSAGSSAGLGLPFPLL